MQTSRTREQIRMLLVLGRLSYFHLSHYYKSLPNLGSPHLAVLSQSSTPNLLLWLYIVHQKPPGMSHACRPLLQEHSASVPRDLPQLNFLTLTFYRRCACAESLQSCPALCDAVDCGLPGSSVHRSLQARLYDWATGEALCWRHLTWISGFCAFTHIFFSTWNALLFSKSWTHFIIIIKYFKHTEKIII